MGGNDITVYLDDREVARAIDSVSGPAIEIFEGFFRDELLRDLNNNGPMTDYIKVCVLSGASKINLSDMGPAEPLRPDERPMVFGWRLAAALETRGRLLPGDLRFNQNNTLSYWTSNDWEDITVHGTVD